MLTEQEKLDFLLRAIVCAGGPEQNHGISDEDFMLEISKWLLWNSRPAKTVSGYACDCEVKP